MQTRLTRVEASFHYGFSNNHLYELDCDEVEYLRDTNVSRALGSIICVKRFKLVD